MPLPPAALQEARQLREIILYFGAPDGKFLVAEGREILDCLEVEDCIEATVQALVDGPLGDLAPIFPSHAVVRQVVVAEDMVTVDFSRELVSAHPGGSRSELLTAYGLANTLAANFPFLRQVQILLEGKPAETIKGHVDLRQPIQADFRFSQPVAETGADPAALDALDALKGWEEGIMEIEIQETPWQ